MKLARTLCNLLVLVSTVMVTLAFFASPLMAQTTDVSPSSGEVDPAMPAPTLPIQVGEVGRYSQDATDPGGAEDPLLTFEPNTLGYPRLPSDLNPALMGWPTGTTTATTTAVSPIRVDLATNRYFLYNGLITILVGVSADNACHLHLDSTGATCQVDPSKPAYYQQVLSDAHTKGLNKVRLVVGINGGNWPTPATNCTGAAPNPFDQPFVYKDSSTPNECTTSNPCPNGVGHFYLDQRNMQFFTNLQSVVAYAKQQNIFVEVTFFAPWVAIWELGPWHPNHGRLTGQTAGTGFTDRSYSVKIDTSTTTGPTNEALRAYQKKVIDWTVDALSSYDNIYFEIANEPENWLPGADNPIDVNNNIIACGFITPLAAHGSDIVSWQSMMISELTSYEQNNYVNTGLLAYRHLIAVQPFSSTQGTTPYLPGGSVSGVTVINGHYTTVNTNHGGQGAIQLARSYANQPRVLGFNEGKISGIGGNQGTCGNGSCSGQPDSARAEAWEFMLDGGGTFDHFGYYYTSTYGVQVRQQVDALKTFVSSLPVRQLVTLGDPPPTDSWVNIGASPYIVGSGNKYWASLKPSSAATTMRYVLYIHHSQPRLRSGSTTQFLAFEGYQPLFSTYSESLKLCFGSQAGTFLVQWINPSTGGALDPTHPSQTISWLGSTTCGNGGPGSVVVTTPVSYPYDVALLVTKQ